MAKDILMWVGRCYYPTPWDFIKEALEKGITKRVPNVPDIKRGVSRCYLLHQCGGKRPRCFGYFVISDVAVLCIPEVIASLKAQYGNQITTAPRSAFPAGERVCGEMVMGGYYLCSPNVWEKAKLGRAAVIHSPDIIILPEPWPMLSAGYPHFRGYSYIDGEDWLKTLCWPKRR